jgi:acetoacetyl-CoA synthetase
MMWTVILTGLACGSRVILYDGSPFHPDVRTFLKFINDQGYLNLQFIDHTHTDLFCSVSILGTSPRFLMEVQGQGINPRE